MPTAARHACAHPRCPRLVERGRARCPEHERAYGGQRRETRPELRLYHDGGWWRAFRKTFLAEHPLCVDCGKPATVVDHVTPHRGDPAKFRAGPFAARCAGCHSRKTALEDGGFGHTPRSRPQ